MKYKRFIEENFLIDEPKTGKLVPFIFNKVQAHYYDELIKDYDIEKNGITNPIRDEILKARREGFSSLILALFGADDILQVNPTETNVISYKDDATETFRRRYRNYVLSYAARKLGYTIDQIQTNPGILDLAAKQFLDVDGTDIVLRHNKAHFYCGTANARVGGRGGVLQKLLFSEAAHYPNSDKMTAKEVIDGTMRQIDINSGWVFIESTANGYGNYYQLIWSLAVKGLHRFKARFYGWREFYSEEDFEKIKLEMTDKDMLKQEYPETPDEAFIASGNTFFNKERISEQLKACPVPIDVDKTLISEKLLNHYIDKTLLVYELPQDFISYVAAADVAEGKGKDSSTVYLINNKTLEPAAEFDSNKIRPDEFAIFLDALGRWYNNAYLAVESNAGLWVLTELFEKLHYPNLYWREAIDDVTHAVRKQLGYHTGTGSQGRKVMLDNLLVQVNLYDGIWTKDFLNQCLVFVKNSLGRPAAMDGEHDDCIIAAGICHYVRDNAPAEIKHAPSEPQTVEQRIMARLQKKKEEKEGTRSVSQSNYL